MLLLSKAGDKVPGLLVFGADVEVGIELLSTARRLVSKVADEMWKHRNDSIVAPLSSIVHSA